MPTDYRDRTLSIWDGLPLKEQAKIELVDIYRSAYEHGRDAVPSGLFDANTRTARALDTRWDKWSKNDDPEVLVKLAKSDEQAMGEFLFAGAAGATDFSFEIYESYFMGDQFEMNADQDSVQEFAETMEVSADEVSDGVDYVVQTAFTDGIESSVYEAAVDAVVELAEAELVELKDEALDEASASTTEEIESLIEPLSETVIQDYEIAGEDVKLELTLKKWQAEKLLKHMTRYYA